MPPKTRPAITADDTEMISGRFDPEDKERVMRAFARCGWSTSAGVRNVLKAFADSPKVHEAVLAHLRAAAA